MAISNLVTIKTCGVTESGYLSFFESERDIEFQIKRIYYIYDVPVGLKRGMHAHKDLQQLLWCPYGDIDIILDNGELKETYSLSSPEIGLIVPKGIWREMIWRKEGSVLCVAASDYYIESDYIRDYSDYLKHVEGGYWENENKL